MGHHECEGSERGIWTSVFMNKEGQRNPDSYNQLIISRLQYNSETLNEVCFKSLHMNSEFGLSCLAA